MRASELGQRELVDARHVAHVGSNLGRKPPRVRRRYRSKYKYRYRYRERERKRERDQIRLSREEIRGSAYVKDIVVRTAERPSGHQRVARRIDNVQFVQLQSRVQVRVQVQESRYAGTSVQAQAQGYIEYLSGGSRRRA